jgi:hypothetical protein
MKHDDNCRCPGCVEMGTFNSRSPKAILADARRGTDDKFAFGILLRLEQVLAGVAVLPSKMLSQSAEPTPDPNAGNEDLYQGGFRFRGYR